MQAYDLIMLIVLAATTIFGAIKGFAWQLASLASIVASYFVAYFFRNDVAKMINAQPPWNLFLAMLLLYFGSSLIIWMAFRLVSTSIDKVRLKEFDRHLGAGFGLLKGMLLCLIITMFAMTLLGSAQQQRIANSRSGLYITRILASSDGLLPAELKQIVGPYINNFEQRLQQNQSGLTMPTQPGPLDGLGQMLQDRVSQFGSEALTNPQQPGGFFTGAGQGGQPQDQVGSFFGFGAGQANPSQSQSEQNGAGQGGAIGFPNNLPWGGTNNSQPNWPNNAAPQQNNSGWPNGFQNGFGGNEVLPR